MKCEILAPAGSKEQLEAAVRSGANAVYLGLKGFNARNNAENFDDLSLLDAVSYCHARGVKVYVAFNIIVYDTENNVYEAAESIAKSGADGVIVQDMGVATIFKKCCPNIPIHISTQGAIHNSLGVQFASENGFSRCILARELSFDEIKEICSKKPENMELETFVHGALCVSASGNCLLSACIGGRSGNRGVCAQPCRLNFKHNGREFALSLKDMSYVDNAKNIADLGICSLKIEGRMKRAEYVAATVNQLKKALNDEDVDNDILRKVFSRSGFTTGYLDANRNGKMFGIRTKEDVLSSGEIQNSLHELYKRENQSVAVDMTLTLSPEKNAILTMSDGVNTVTAKGNIPFVAENKPTNEESAYNFLSKLGGTPFFLDNLKVKNDDGLMLPPSALKDMRRRCEQELLSVRSQVKPYDFKMN
ncbi:MAG: U32 family peptidase, partial [Clostridia bacterium]|nr:U32 family peptidase [Clostridia bacterium]